MALRMIRQINNNKTNVPYLRPKGTDSLRGSQDLQEFKISQKTSKYNIFLEKALNNDSVFS